eukprot:scaffold454_cov158-Skeletonema_dohrnii-CCMP3373.AAC.4
MERKKVLKPVMFFMKIYASACACAWIRAPTHTEYLEFPVAYLCLDYGGGRLHWTAFICGGRYYTSTLIVGRST